MGRQAEVIHAKAVLAAFIAAIATSASAAACRTQPQLIVVIDTDLILPSQLAADPSLPRVGSFDRVRIQMLGADGLPSIFAIDEDTLPSEIDREISVTADTAWPLTFGLRASEPSGERTARMRIRVYRSESVLSLARASNISPRELTLDRLAIVTIPEDGVETVRVVLAGDCIGTKSDAEASFDTCVTGHEDIRDAREGVERLAGDVIPPTVAGTWARARVTPCVGSAPNAGAVCIAGGLDARGSPTFTETVGDFVASFPEHLVHLAPFFIDPREVTVRRYRAILGRGALGGVALPTARSAADPLCTWTASPGPFEDRPLNCASAILAAAVCKAEAGDLPTDAQWEHAARLGHRATPYVWGDLPASCCSARIASPLGCGVTGVAGPVDVGSFADPNACEGTSDVSGGGLLDLTGNVRELVRDSPIFYATRRCPLDPIAEDPTCIVERLPSMARGGSFRSTFDQAKIGARSVAPIGADDVGFRCAYPDRAP